MLKDKGDLITIMSIMWVKSDVYRLVGGQEYWGRGHHSQNKKNIVEYAWQEWRFMHNHQPNPFLFGMFANRENQIY